MEYLYLIFTLLYALQIVRFTQGWLKIPVFKSKDQKYLTRVNVIVPFRNEKDNLAPLLLCLQNQSYPDHLSHYYFVNDSSTDGGDRWLADHIENIPHFTLLEAEGQGKKHALELAYKQVKGELIVTLDADCEVHQHWLSTIAGYYQETGHKLIICPVMFKEVRSLWEKIQAIEFQSLIVSGAGAAANNEAIMCNGANLAFSATLIKYGTDFLNVKEQSGDDMFLLEHVKKHFPTQIGFLKSKWATAFTTPASVSQFFKQRSRWTSKSKSYKDMQIIYVGFLVLMINLLIALSLPLAILFHDLWKPLFFTFSIKFLLDLALLWSSARFFHTLKDLYLSVIIALVYPYYVLYSVMHGLFGTLKWKGR